jgi:hypothetical protein
LKVLICTIGLLLGFGLIAQAAEVFLILDENVDDIIKNLTNGAGTAKKVTGNDAYTKLGGKESLMVTIGGGDSQKFNPNMPGWNFQIKENPKAKGEFRYISWVWRKQGGNGVQLQLHGIPATWGHRYHAQANVLNWNPSIQIQKEIPKEWTTHTADLFTDWKEFILTGIAFTTWDGEFSLWDKVVLHQTKENPLAKKEAVEPNGKLATTWGKLRSHLP